MTSIAIFSMILALLLTGMLAASAAAERPMGLIRDRFTQDYVAYYGNDTDLFLYDIGEYIEFCIFADLRTTCLPHLDNGLPISGDCALVTRGCECLNWGLDVLPQFSVTRMADECVELYIPKGVSPNTTLELVFAPQIDFPVPTLEAMSQGSVDEILDFCESTRKDVQVFDIVRTCRYRWVLYISRIDTN